MIVKMESIRYDENSTEMKDLVLRGVNVGQYSFGLYSKWINNYKMKNKKTIPCIENFVCGKLHELLQTDVLNQEDVKNAEIKLLETYKIDICQWFTEYMENDCR